MNINKKITKVNKTVANKQNKYIVIHYVGAVSSAQANANYFYEVNRGASAHYFVDEKEIWQVVEDKDYAWHCGASKYYNECRNSNSIGIEMCCKKSNGNWYIENDTVKKTIELTRHLMAKYHIDIEHVVRHYDVTKKICPEPFIRDEQQWKNFLKSLKEEKMFDNEFEALEFLVEKGRITDKEYWLSALKIVNNLKWLLIKWANDVVMFEH